MSEDGAAQISKFSQLGHDLRTPLSLIQGYVSLLGGDELTSEQRRAACAVMREKCDEMNRLIRTFLSEPSSQDRRAVESETPDLQVAR